MDKQWKQGEALTLVPSGDVCLCTDKICETTNSRIAIIIRSKTRKVGDTIITAEFKCVTTYIRNVVIMGV